VLLDRQTAVHLHGKSRKQRVIPLWKNTAGELRGWLKRINSAPNAPVFPNRAGAPLTRSGVRDRLDRAVAAAEPFCPSLHGQHVTPHTLRHSQCTCCSRARTWRSSRYGLGIPARPSRISTSSVRNCIRRASRIRHSDSWRPEIRDEAPLFSGFGRVKLVG